MNRAQSRLTDSDRVVMCAIREATACNPFTARRQELDRVTIVAAGGPAGGTADIVEMTAAVRNWVMDLDRRGLADLQRVGAPDREGLRTALLFDRFHSCCDQMDAHIGAQIAAGRVPLPVPFAADSLAGLRGFGLSQEEALRMFAAFFQLRRAYYFIRDALIGTSASMQALRAQLWNNVFTHDFLQYERDLWNRMEDFSTLLVGETGTGKGAAAAAIGRSGFIPFDATRGCFAESFTDILIGVNLSQFAEALIESELFGHRRGAFTGAIDNHEGVFARCRPNGAIFMDEIGDLAPPVQLKLLRVLQERVFTPVGSHDERRFAGRVIAATNRPLEALRRGGTFRDDFYYRLCSDRISMPPLRQRLSEDPAEFDDLVRHILTRLCGEAGAERTGDVAARLRRAPGPDYSWPGNVRELEQAVRAVLLNGVYAGDPAARAADETGAGTVSLLARDIESGSFTAQVLAERYCQLLYTRSQNYGEVARRTGLDRRTVRKYVARADASVHQVRGM